MGEARASTLVYILVVVLSLVAFGFAIAAERRRSVVSISSYLSLTCTFLAAAFQSEAHFSNELVHCGFLYLHFKYKGFSSSGSWVSFDACGI